MVAGDPAGIDAASASAAERRPVIVENRIKLLERRETPSRRGARPDGPSHRVGVTR